MPKCSKNNSISCMHKQIRCDACTETVTVRSERLRSVENDRVRSRGCSTKNGHLRKKTEPMPDSRVDPHAPSAGVVTTRTSVFFCHEQPGWTLYPGKDLVSNDAPQTKRELTQACWGSFGVLAWCVWDGHTSACASHLCATQVLARGHSTSFGLRTR